MDLQKKLQFKEPERYFSNAAPKELVEHLRFLTENPVAENGLRDLDFILIFVREQDDLDDWLDKLGPNLRGDGHFWFAYPKKSSKNYSSEITRDSGWAKIGEYRMEPVRQIALNEDWSALRFRKLAFIKKLTRRDSMRLSK